MHPGLPDARQACPPASSENGSRPEPAARRRRRTDQRPCAGKPGENALHRQPDARGGDQAALTASIRRSVIWLSVARLAETVIVSLPFAGTKSRTWLPEDNPAQPWPAPVTDR